MARQYKILYFSQAPWTIGEREANRDARVKADEPVALADLYPNSHPGRVISIIPEAKSFSEGDLKDPTRSTITLSLTEKQRNALASRETYIKDGKAAPVPFEARWGRLAEVLRASFDDPEAAEREADAPQEDPAAFELTDGWRFAELAALNKRMLPKTAVHSGAGLYDVGPLKTYSTIQSALDQLWTDQGSDAFTASQYIRIFAGTYDETVTPNASFNPDEQNGYLLIIEGDPTDDRANIKLEPATGNGIYLNCDHGIIRHMHIHPQENAALSGVQTSTGCAGLRVEDCEIQTLHASAFAINTRQAVQVMDSTIVATNGVGIYCAFSYGSVVKRCSVTSGGSGLYFGRGSFTAEDVVLSGCASGILIISLYQQQVSIRQCTFYDCTIGISLWSATPSNVEISCINSVFKDCTENLRMPATAVWPEETATRYGPHFTLRNNCFHGYTDFATDGTDTKTQAQFNALSGVDSADNLGGDPLLTDPNSGDFSLQDASICRRAGHGSGVVEDYLGTVFHTAHPDIGAWSSGNRNSSPALGTIVDDETGTSLTVTVDANNNTLDETWAYYSANDGLTWTLFPTTVTGDGDIQITGLSTWREYRVQLVTSRNGSPGNEGAQGSCLSMTVTDGTSRSWQNVCNTIRTRFKTEIVDSISGGLPTMYDNDGAFDKPEDGRWCRFSIRPADSEQVEMGDLRRYRTPGVAIAQVFVPVGKGDKDALAVADAIKTAFRSVTVSGVKFKTPSLQVMGREGDKWQVNVTIPFYVDEVI